METYYTFNKKWKPIIPLTEKAEERHATISSTVVYQSYMTRYSSCAPEFNKSTTTNISLLIILN